MTQVLSFNIFGSTQYYTTRVTFFIQKCITSIVTQHDISYKSGNMEEELKNSKNAIFLCGGKYKKIEKFILPDSDMERSFIFIEKMKNQTDFSIKNINIYL